MRPVLLSLVALALLLPGCATPGALQTAGDGKEALSVPFGAAKAMAQPTGGAEPNIAVAPDGTIWITAVAGSQERPNHEEGAAWLWRSKDNGTTWDTLRAPQRDTPLGSVPQTRRPFGSSDADVTVSPDGWVYYSDWWNWGAPATVPDPVGLPVSPNNRYGSYLVEASGDGGKTWQHQSVTTLDSFGGVDRQWLVAGKDGFVGLFYAYFHGPNPSRPSEAPDALAGKSSIQAVFSRDHGQTWTKPTTVVESDVSAFNQIGHPRLTASGLLWMPHAWATQQKDYWTEPGEVRVALSKDLGQTWKVVKVADVPGGFDNLWAVQGDHDANGVLHVAWAGRTGQEMIVWHSESADEGQTWSAPDRVSAPGTAFLPWVAARGDGEVAISFYYANVLGEPGKAPADTAWYSVVAHRAGAGAPWTTSDASLEPVKKGPMCAKGGACTGDRELLDYSGIAFGPEGAMHVAFATSRLVAGAKAGQVMYAHAG